jgi:protocatechuate 3,4-dioxygenase beta subunit
MENDDLPVGRVLSRREAIRALGLAGVGAVVTACGDSGTEVVNEIPAGTCVARPALTIGPYFVDEKLNRTDIRSDPTTGAIKPGVPLRLTFNVSQLNGGACSALAGALVDVWHCDHLGIYSDVVDPGFNTLGQKWLRGYQETNANGVAAFATIYPGWYQGRTVHLHYRIRSASGAGTGFDFVSQLFFTDTLSDQIFALSPYAARTGVRGTRNTNDGIYQQGGSALVLDPTPDGAGGYSTAFNVAVQR